MANRRRRRYAPGMSILYVESPVGRLALEADGGKEGGFSGGQGLPTKRKLLALEGVVLL